MVCLGTSIHFLLASYHRFLYSRTENEVGTDDSNRVFRKAPSKLFKEYPKGYQAMGLRKYVWSGSTTLLTRSGRGWCESDQKARVGGLVFRETPETHRRMLPTIGNRKQVLSSWRSV